MTNTNPPYEDLPKDPELNPPETLEELETLIDKLQAKSASIKQQIEVVAIREKQRLPVDYDRLKRTIFARSQTNKSITALQKIAKQKRQELVSRLDTSFEKRFFETAKDVLPTDKFAEILNTTYSKLITMEKELKDKAQ